MLFQHKTIYKLRKTLEIALLKEQHVGSHSLTIGSGDSYLCLQTLRTIYFKRKKEIKT